MNLLNLLLWPFLLPVLLLVYALWPKSRPFFPERLGLGKMRIDKAGYLLLHVASLGEARAAKGLITELSKRAPLLLTTMTVSGRTSLAASHADLPVSLAPLDLPGLWKPFLKSRRIRGILLFETEIWPSMLLTAKELGIPVGIVNGRLSSRSMRRFGVLKPLVRPLFRRLSPVLVQTPQDRDRFIRLGVSGDSVQVTGNLKWDVDRSFLDPERLEGGREWLGITPGPPGEGERPVVRILGSSVHPGEAEALWHSCRALSARNLSVQCILAPRHLEVIPSLLSRLSAARVFFRKGGPSPVGKTGASPSDTLYLLNTYGEMGSFLALADIVFVGGTLDPVGGHSPVEASFHGKPILWGPHRDHIADLSERLMAQGAAMEVAKIGDLEEALFLLATDRERREEMGRKSREVFLSEGGPLLRTMKALDPFLSALFRAAP